MNENTPLEDNATPKPAPEPTVEQPVAQEPEAPTQTLDPAPPAPPAPPADATTPHWAREKFSRNSVVGGAAVAGAVVALIGASLVGDDEHGKGDRMSFRGGPPQMQGGGQFGGPPGQGGQQGGQPSDGQLQGPDGQGGPGMQGQNGQDPNGQGQGQDQGQSDQTDSK